MFCHPIYADDDTTDADDINDDFENGYLITAAPTAAPERSDEWILMLLNACIANRSIPNVTFDTTAKTPPTRPQLSSDESTTSPTQFRHELNAPSLFKVYESIERNIAAANKIGTTDSIRNDINSCLEYIKSLLNIQSMNYVKSLCHRVAPYHRSDNDDNYDDNNNNDIIVAYGTKNLSYARPIISTNQVERWGVSIMNKMILQVEFYSFDPCAIPHRYYYHQVVTKRFVERLQQLRKVFATIARQNQEERWGATIINNVIIKLRSTCLHLYICLMQCYFNFTHTRKRRSVASRWGVLNCEQLIVNQYS